MPAGAADAAVGMMDSAYFTGRRELLDFFNDLLALNLTKIEQTASGAVACQIMDYIFPGSIPVEKINWEAKSDFEFIGNYKLLQKGFIKHRVQRHVDVDKLIRAKYQDNLEFCQWLKAFFDQSGVRRPDYDPVAVRSKGKGGKKMIGQSRSVTSRPVPTASRRTAPTGSTKTATSKPLRERTQASQPQGNLKNKSGNAIVADAALTKKNTELTARNEELAQNLIDIEKERNFYFEKLRDIEVMLQVYQEKDDDNDKDPNSLIEKIFKVLYATAEDGLIVNDDGEILGQAETEPEDALFDDE